MEKNMQPKKSKRFESVSKAEDRFSPVPEVEDQIRIVPGAEDQIRIVPEVKDLDDVDSLENKIAEGVEAMIRYLSIGPTYYGC